MDFSKIEKEALKKINSVEDLDELDNIRLFYLGKKGLIPQEMKKLGDLPAEEKKELGKNLNNIKSLINSKVEQQKISIQEMFLNKKLLCIDLLWGFEFISYNKVNVIITNIILIGIAAINWILDSNYFYLFRPPDVNNPLILTNQHPLYFLNMELVSIIVLYIISIPMLIYRKKIEN